MRFFASSHRLDQLAPRTRLLCALFLFGMLLQGVSGILMHHHGPGWSPQSIATYYRGDDASALAEDANDQETPSAPTTISLGRSFAGLLEVAHFHLVAMPLVIFVVAHLFSMTSAGRTRWGGFLCGLALLSAFADIFAPFAVAYLSASFALVKLGAFIALEASFLTMSGITFTASVGSFAAPAGDPSRSA